MPVGQLPGSGRRHRLELGAEGTAIGQRAARSSTRLAPGGIGLQVGRFDPRCTQHGLPVSIRGLQRRDGARGGPAALNPAGGQPRLCRRGSNHPPAVAVGNSNERTFGCRVGGEPAATEHHLGADDLGGAALQRSPPTGRSVPGGSGRCSPVGVPCLENGLPPGAPAEVGVKRPCGPVPVGWGPLGGRCPQTGEPHHDSRGAEPALAPTGGAEGVGPCGQLCRIQALQCGHRPTGHPTGRRHTRDPGLPVDQHRAAPALALGAAAVLHRPVAESVAE